MTRLHPVRCGKSRPVVRHGGSGRSACSTRSAKHIQHGTQWSRRAAVRIAQQRMAQGLRCHAVLERDRSHDRGIPGADARPRCRPSSSRGRVQPAAHPRTGLCRRCSGMPPARSSGARGRDDWEGDRVSSYLVAPLGETQGVTGAVSYDLFTLAAACCSRGGRLSGKGALVKDGAPGWPFDDPVARSAASPPGDQPITARSPPNHPPEPPNCPKIEKAPGVCPGPPGAS